VSAVFNDSEEQLVCKQDAEPVSQRIAALDEFAQHRAPAQAQVADADIAGLAAAGVSA